MRKNKTFKNVLIVFIFTYTVCDVIIRIYVLSFSMVRS